MDRLEAAANLDWSQGLRPSVGNTGNSAMATDMLTDIIVGDAVASDETKQTLHMFFGSLGWLWRVLTLSVARRPA